MPRGGAHPVGRRPLLQRGRRAAGVRLGYAWEALFVNDGSMDRTLPCLRGIAADLPQAAILNLSRNFGKEAAMTAGLDYSTGDAAIMIDADLQDPPELIADLVAKWHEGYDVVYAQRRARDGETLLKRSTASTFYRLMRRTSRVAIPVDTGDFRLMSRRAVDSLLRLRERHRFMKGLFAWIGYPQIAVAYDRKPRHRIFNEVKQRPLYVVERFTPARTRPPRPAEPAEAGSLPERTA